MPLHGRYLAAVLLRGLAMAAAGGGGLILLRLVFQHLGDGGLAAWGLLLQAATLLVMLDLGLGTAVVRLAESPGPGFWPALSRLLWQTGALSAAVLSILAVAGPSLVGIPPAQSGEFTATALVLAGGQLVRFRLGIGAWLLYRLNDPRPAAVVELALSAGRPLAACLAVALGGGLLGTGVAWVAAELAITACAQAAAGRLPVGAAAPGAARAILAEALPVALVSLVSSMPVYLAGWAIGRHGEIADINRWQCAFALPLLCLRCAYMPQTVAFPALVRLSREGPILGGLARHMPLAGAYAATVVAAVAALAGCNAPFVTWWMGPAFAPPLLLSLAIGGWLLLTTARAGLNAVAVASRGQERGPLIAHAAEVLLIAVLAAPALAWGGLAGYAAMMCAAHLLPLGANLQAVLRTRERA